MSKMSVFLLKSFSAVALLITAITAGGLSGMAFDSEIRTSPGPSPGIVLVTCQEYRGQPSTFSSVNNEIRTQLGENTLSSLKDFGLDKLQVVSTRANTCTYALMFNSVGRENDIIQYLKSMPQVIEAKRDYPITFLIEPNDYHYQPDSTDTLGHWVPYDMNTYKNNSRPLRVCSRDYQTCCCEAPCDSTFWGTYQTKDSIHVGDQWYLQRAQVNKAWDIDRGESSVKILVIDSGIDAMHPDLSANIWDNSSLDPVGDADHDGMPGGGYGFASARVNRDIDGDGLMLWGTGGINGECDCGPDGDYGFGPNGIDDDPSGPGGGDDHPGGGSNDPWEDNIAPQFFNDDRDDIVFMKNDDDANGYPDDTHGVNLYDPVQDYGLSGVPDGLPGVKGWGDEDLDKDGGKHFNDPDVAVADFDGDGIPLCGANDTCDAGLDGDYGFGPNGIDDTPRGPEGGDDVASAWADNLRGPGSLHPELEFDDDMHDVYFLRFDNEEDGNPLGGPFDDSCPKAFGCHGTQMAGIIGAETNNTIGVAGYAWNCSLISAKIAIGGPENEYASRPYVALERLVEAIDYGIEKEVDIINMSLGNYSDENGNFLNDSTLQAKITEAYNDGIVIVAGAGNRDTTLYTYPASLNNVISASGANRFEFKAVNVNYNDKVDVCAPIGDWDGELDGGRGADCMTTAYTNNPHTLFPTESCDFHCHGYAASPLQTSGATAEVSGLSALLVSLYPKSMMQDIMGAQYSPAAYVDFIESQIKRGCVAMTDESHFAEGKLGAGRINAYRSMTQWGRIRNDTTWARFAYVSADLKIDAGKTLTIEPGTVIYFAPDDNDNQYDPTVLEFRVEGELIAEGTVSNPIEFKSLSENPQPGDWAGIQVFGNTGSASLSYCNVSDAYHGIKSYRPVQIAHSNFANCEVHGIYLEGSGANGSQISSCTANGNGSCGIMFNDCDNVTVGSSEANSNYHGVWLTSSNPGAVNYTSAKYNTSNGIRADNCYYDFSHCYVEDNDQQGMYLTNTRGTISNCKIWKNSANGIYCVGSTCDPAVDHSKIEQNQVGVRVASGGCPKLGDIDLDWGQNNSIFNQPTYVYASPSYVLMAENCWWGTAPGTAPDPNKFKGNVDYFPYLSSDPVQYLASMKPEISNEASTSFSLAQNSPNPVPVAAATIIRYSIPRGTERVTLTVYDVSGRKVKTLVNDVVNGGEYSTTWDCRNQKGSRVVPGIYFYRLSVGNKFLTKKIVLIQN